MILVWKVWKLIKKLANDFNLIVFSSVDKEEGEKILEIIDPNKLITKSYFRDVDEKKIISRVL